MAGNSKSRRFEKLKQAVLAANLELPKRGLVVYTWGNVSAIDRKEGVVAIKPSGVYYEDMTEDDIVVVDMDGAIVEGNKRPSSDTPTHIVLYRAFSEIGAVVHTHSSWATAWAQAGLDIECYGTTHADHFYGSIPCTRELSSEEIRGDYEAATGRVIVETFASRDPSHCPGVLVKNHGPFTWGKTPADAVYNSVVLEEVARMAFVTTQLHPHANPICQPLQDKHFFRKHGPGAYYGQQ